MFIPIQDALNKTVRLGTKNNNEKLSEGNRKNNECLAFSAHLHNDCQYSIALFYIKHSPNGAYFLSEIYLSIGGLLMIGIFFQILACPVITCHKKSNP